VSVLTRVNKHGDFIKGQGIDLIPVNIDRSGFNVFADINYIIKIVSIYKLNKPDIVHHVALKPILYGTLAAILTNVRAIINAPVGLGYVFNSKQLKAFFIRPFVYLAYFFLLNPKHSLVIFENPDNLAFMAKLKMVKPKSARVIRGAGVSLLSFRPCEESSGLPVIVLAARMLWDKGIGEFVEAARLLIRQAIECRFVLVGESDTRNPEHIPCQQLKDWEQEGIIEWWGYQADMPSIFQKASVVCLPSYAEGLPKVLIEAAASARAIVTTNIPGCREVVSDGVNGFLVPVGDSVALASALKKLILDRQLRKQMGQAGRSRVEREFSDEIVSAQTLNVYHEML